MQWLIQYAFALLSRTHRYQYGGTNPIVGYDCSGYVQELLMAAGELPWDAPKKNAQEIFELYEHTASHSYGAGALAFYGKDLLHISHVGFCLDPYLMLSAASGDSKCVNDEVAIQENAFLKMRTIHYRSDFLTVLKPAYVKIGMIK